MPILLGLPEVGDEIDTENLKEAPLVDGSTDGREPEHDSDVRDDDLTTLVGTEHHSLGVEVLTCRGSYETQAGSR